MIEISPPNAYIDPESELRFYTWKERTDLISSTSVRKAAGQPRRLVQWQISRVVERAVDGHDELLAMLTRERKPRERVLEKNRRKEASSWLRGAATEERDRKSALGTAIHQVAATGQVPPDGVLHIPVGRKVIDVTIEDMRPRLSQYADWLATSGVEILATEAQVFNLTLGYGGSMDILCRYRDGSIGIVDIKTGGECDCDEGKTCPGGHGVYGDHVIQQVAYLHGEFIGRDDVVDERLTGFLHRVSRVALLHLDEHEWEWRELEMEDGAWEAFCGLLPFARWATAHEEPDSFSKGTRRGSATAQAAA